jgi:hypothetical protein
MALLIGMDEAGYGPNLGPLVISATVWEIPGNPKKCDLWGEFSGIVDQAPPEDGSHIQIADSKAVYSPARGLANLENGVLHALSLWRRSAPDEGAEACGSAARIPGTFRALLREVATVPPEAIDCEPWYVGCDLPLPAPEPAALCESWSRRCRARKIRLRAIRSEVVLTRRFNDQVRSHDNKARALSEMSMQLLRHVWSETAGDGHDSALILADKHGGRNRYHEFLPIVFGDRFIRCHAESLDASRYRVGNAEVRFEARSERYLPVALASMVSKYVRELAMVLFNRFWVERQPNLKPTAGYPGDSRRFKEEITALQKALGITEQELWRER